MLMGNSNSVPIKSDFLAKDAEGIYLIDDNEFISPSNF